MDPAEPDITPLARALGDLLAARRNSTGLTQRELARAIGYGRATIAGAETGARVPSKAFWTRADNTLNADGALLNALQQIVTARKKKRREATARDLAERNARATAHVATLERPLQSVLVGNTASLPPNATKDLLLQLNDAMGSGSLDAGGLLRPTLIDAAGLMRLRRRVAGHWKQYQSSSYHTLLAQLPDTLRALNAIATTGQDSVQLHDIRSRAYQLAASIAYKYGDLALGLIAAERGLSAAGSAGDPLLGGIALTRLTHGLRNAGHIDRAIDLNLRGAASIEEDGDMDDPARASVYGALLLHSSIATARNGDSGTAQHLVEDAHFAARHSGEGNHYYTAFGPTNVEVWTVAILMRLGDFAGAIDSAARVNVELLPVAERKGAFLTDYALAYASQGANHDEKAASLMLEAHHIAPGEVFGRPGNRALIQTLARRAKPSWSEPIRRLNARMENTK